MLSYLFSPKKVEVISWPTALCVGLPRAMMGRSLNEMLTPEQQKHFRIREPEFHRFNGSCCLYSKASMHGHFMHKKVHTTHSETHPDCKVLRTEYEVACLDPLGLDAYPHVRTFVEEDSEGRQCREDENWGSCLRCHEFVHWKTVSRQVIVDPTPTLTPNPTASL